MKKIDNKSHKLALKKKSVSTSKKSNNSVQNVSRNLINKKKVEIKKQIRQNRPFHKKIMLHPFSMFLILCMVVFIVDWTFRVAADSYTVTAQVLAPVLDEGATITSLTDNETVTSAPITISGTCPANSYVNLYINNLFAGADYCINQVFTIQTDLYVGENTITAKDFNVTDAQGPTTPSYNVTLAVPKVTNSIGASNSTQPIIPALILDSSYYYQTFTTGNSFTWQVNLAGGEAPYTLNVNWGDGTFSKLIFKTDPTFTIRHKYAKPGYYKVVINATDSAKNQRIIQLAALIKLPGSPSLASTIPKTIPESVSYTINNFFVSSKVWLWAAWSSLIVVILMLVSFILGEREQRTRILKKQLPKISK